MKTPAKKVPDLLHRFEPTPYSTQVDVGRCTVRVESNDPEIIAATSRLECSLSVADERSSALWILVREKEAGPEYEPQVFNAAELLVLLSGGGTMVAVDHNRGEAFGFIGPEVRANQLQNEILPFLVKWCAA